jgi:hypothetical protein
MIVKYFLLFQTLRIGFKTKRMLLYIVLRMLQNMEEHCIVSQNQPDHLG